MLTQVKKPEGRLELDKGSEMTVKGHRMKGYYDENGDYYEHDECCDRWFRLN